MVRGGGAAVEGVGPGCPVGRGGKLTTGPRSWAGPGRTRCRGEHPGSRLDEVGTSGGEGVETPRMSARDPAGTAGGEGVLHRGAGVAGPPGIAVGSLGPLWQRAAVLGSLWAGSEIVLGAFLHNLRVPLRGFMLTAIAVAIMAAGRRIWPLRGLVVRAGAIAALMKSVSPSAVLLGPMLAIAMEGCLMEVGLRVGRGRLGGYLLGGALAMSWTMGHKVASLLITYGTDVVRLYTEVVAWAERQLGPLPLRSWGPLLALAVLNCALGMAAAWAGYRLVGRGWRAAEVGREAAFVGASLPNQWRAGLGGPPGGGPRPHPLLLAFWGVVLPVGLWAMSRLVWWEKAVVAGAVAGVVAGRYRRGLRRLSRPEFWGGLLLVTLAAGAILGTLGSGVGGWRGGLAVGLGMSAHAIFVTLCFAALTTELTHPAVRRLLKRVGGGRLHQAVQAAFATLPMVVAALPSGREFLRRPGQALAELLPRLDGWLLSLEESFRVVGVVTGGKGVGKTTLTGEVVEALRREGFRVGGILTPGILRDGRRWSFEVVDLGGDLRLPMATRDPSSPWPKVGAFHVNPEALEMGRKALARERMERYDLGVVDEVGPWEMMGEGWAEALEDLRGSRIPLLLVVRKELLADVLGRLAPGGAPIWEVGNGARREEIVEGLRSVLKDFEGKGPGGP